MTFTLRKHQVLLGGKTLPWFKTLSDGHETRIRGLCAQRFWSTVSCQGEPLLLGLAVMAAHCMALSNLGEVFPFYNPRRNTVCHKVFSIG